jgi:hypothetical protein
MTNKAQIESWVKDHGEDSDSVRVRVRGVFRRAARSPSSTASAWPRPWGGRWVSDPSAPLVMGIDIGRHGGHLWFKSLTPCRWRESRDCRHCFRGRLTCA